MVAVLGISAFYHDSAAALVVDGVIVAAASEERFTRIKHDSAFPKNAIAYCLKQAGLDESDLDHVGFYEKPLLKFDRLLETYLSFAPAGFRSFRSAMPSWVGQKLRLRKEIRRGLANKYKKRIAFCEHHQSHAASAFFPSPFEEAAILTMDGVGEWATTSIGRGTGNQIAIDQEMHFPHSLGLLYSAFTYFAGFRVNSGEYKLMGLAPYGRPKYTRLIYDHLISLADDGSFAMNMDYFNYCQGLTMTSGKFHRLFGREPRSPETPIETLDKDLAASVQKVTEDIVMRTARHLHDQTGRTNLCMAGGVALNCVANGKLLRDGPFENIWIQPAAGDSGGALGVALLIWHQLMGQEREVRTPDAQAGSLLGPSYDDLSIQEALTESEAVSHYIPDEDELHRIAVEHLANGNVVGRFDGPMEFGPRALGNRSILGDPRCEKMQTTMNVKIKYRESFRPFAPMVLAEHASDFFEMDPKWSSPYMLLVFDVDQDRRIGAQSEETDLRQVSEARSDIPAVTHVDYSARVQTVETDRNPKLHRLLSRFHGTTGCPVLINTSFNVRGEPIVCSPADAIRCFLATEMDGLILGNYWLRKDEQTPTAKGDREEHLSQFSLD